MWKVSFAWSMVSCTNRTRPRALWYLPVPPVMANCSSKTGAVAESLAVPEVVILPSGSS